MHTLSHNLLTFCRALAINSLFYLILIGWGFLCTSPLRAQSKPSHSGHLAAIGAACLICLGGFMVYWQVAPVSQLALIVTGLLGGLIFLFKKAAGLPRFQKIPLVVWLSFGLLLVRVGTSVFGRLDAHDDYHGYLVLTEKILSTGTLSTDFFNERRLGVLGGSAFLQALYLQLAPLHWVTGLDRGVGLLLISGALFSIFPEAIYETRGALLLLLTAILNFRAANITFVYVNAAILLLLAFELSESSADRVFKVATLSILCAACISTKNFMMVPVAALLCVRGLTSAQSRNMSDVVVVACSGLGAVLLLGPWLLLSLNSNGTLFFPLAGLGNHGSRYGILQIINHASLPWLDLIGNLSHYLLQPESLAALSGMLLLLGRNGRRPPWFLLLLALSLVISGWLVVWKAMFIFRYATTILGVAASLVFVLHLRSGRVWAAILCLVLLISLKPAEVAKIFTQPSFAMDDRQKDFDTKRQMMLKMQGALPPGAPVALFASYPFLMDFSRNPVHVFDHYGGACLEPGLPIGDARRLKLYLVSKGISHIAYSYADHANYGREKYSYRLISDGTPYGDRVKQIAALNFQFADMIESLRHTEKVIFDNGDIVLLELETG